MSEISPFDAVDRILLGICLAGPATLSELIGASGYPADAVKSLVHGYAEAGLLSRRIVRFEITLSGRKHLAALTTNHATTRKAA